MPSIVTLTTDFGNDLYVASMKGVILSVNSGITIVDICHSVSPQNIREAAYIIGETYQYFPGRTVHVIVVDPGVGSKRKAVILNTPHAVFVAPDNGTLSYIIEQYCPRKAVSLNSKAPVIARRKLTHDLSAVHITEPRFWREKVSATFHGRDIFAPVAAYLACGVPLERFGERMAYLNVFPVTHPHWGTNNVLMGHVLYIDHFGNLITDIKVAEWKSNIREIRIGGSCIRELCNFYEEKEGLIALTGSSGYLEIAYTNGNASAFLKVGVGDEVEVVVERSS